MMRRWLLVLVFSLLLPGAALAQVVRVTSGDHSDFTRIVLQFGAPIKWHMGRTDDGYELRLPDGAMRYDLSTVFEQITKDRLAAIWADPETGALHFSVACACFAMPFEFRPDTIVVDIRNGDPPPESEFERRLDGEAATTLAPRPAARPQSRPPEGEKGQSYDWTALLPEMDSGRPTVASSTIGLDNQPGQPGQEGLDTLRQSLIEQLSRGASQGIVDMAKPREAPTTETESGPSVRLTLGEEPGLLIRQKGEAPETVTAEGGKCISDEALDIASWSVKPEDLHPAEGEAAAGEAPPAEGHGEAAATEPPAASEEHAAPEGAAEENPNPEPLEQDLPIAEQIALAKTDLLGEFDKPDPHAVERAVRFNLHIGFGAEARSLLRAFPVELEDAPIWMSMAHIIDEDPGKASAFRGMESCATAAALWAVLSDPKIFSLGEEQKAAILRAFSALPSHLRQQLGPTLVERFLQMNDVVSATALRDAIVRVPGEAGPEVELMQAAMDKAAGSPATSVARLEELAKDPGTAAADVLVALVEQRAEIGQNVSIEQVEALEEYTKEHQLTADGPKFKRALTLAYAASGDMDKAFEALPETPEATATVWQILALSGSDSALLTHAILANGEAPPKQATRSASLVATRLLTLGLADHAATWLALANDPPTLLQARVKLAQGKPEAALDLIAGDESPEVLPIRAEALQLLGDEKAAAEIYATLGRASDQKTALARIEDWEGLAAADPEAWKAATDALAATDPPIEAPAPAPGEPALPQPGPLAKGKALVEQSTSTRDAISALLNSVKSPTIPSQ